MNIIARRHTLKSRSSTDWDVPGIVTGKAANPVIRYMNVWDMSMKRPEAHLKPPKDCLHWCMVGVMNYWQEVSEEKSDRAGGSLPRRIKLMNGTPFWVPSSLQLLWNMIVEESKNTDYDVATLRHE
jgi:hypothetical protein